MAIFAAALLSLGIGRGLSRNFGEAAPRIFFFGVHSSLCHLPRSHCGNGPAKRHVRRTHLKRVRLPVHKSSGGPVRRIDRSCHAINRWGWSLDARSNRVRPFASRIALESLASPAFPFLFAGPGKCWPQSRSFLVNINYAHVLPNTVLPIINGVIRTFGRSHTPTASK